MTKCERVWGYEIDRKCLWSIYYIHDVYMVQDEVQRPGKSQSATLSPCSPSPSSTFLGFVPSLLHAYVLWFYISTPSLPTMLFSECLWIHYYFITSPPPPTSLFCHFGLLYCTQTLLYTLLSCTYIIRQWDWTLLTAFSCINEFIMVEYIYMTVIQYTAVYVIGMCPMYHIRTSFAGMHISLERNKWKCENLMK